MSYRLRKYQSDLIELARREFGKGRKRVLMWLNTGGGKGLLMSEIANNTLGGGKKILVVMRRRKLIRQTIKNFKKYHGIDASPLMNGAKGFNRNNRVQVCSIDTLRSRMKDPKYDFLREFDTVMVDECHDTNSPTYQAFFEWMGDKYYIGLTATPFEISGKPLRFWEVAVQSIKAHELRDQGFLAPYIHYAPGEIDTSGIRTINGDFDLKELFKRATELKVIGDVVDSYKKYGQNKPAILFAVNKQHSMIMAHAFNEAGISAIHIDESHSDDERDEAINKLLKHEKEGTPFVLCNVNIFSIGVDIPEAIVGIMARPTMSEILYVQQGGRILRIHPLDYGPDGSFDFTKLNPVKPFAIIIDHAGNWERHGFLYDERQAQLEEEGYKPRKKSMNSKADVLIKKCPNCRAIVEMKHERCPYCSHLFEIKASVPDHVEGELVELDQNDNNIRLKAKQLKMMKRYNQLKALESVRGWKTNAKFFMLYDDFGEDIFSLGLDIPAWVADISRKNKQCPKCNGEDFVILESDRANGDTRQCLTEMCSIQYNGKTKAVIHKRNNEEEVLHAL